MKPTFHHFKLNLYKERIDRETKNLAFKALIDWCLKHAHQYHVIKVHAMEEPQHCALDFIYIRKLPRYRNVKMPRK